MAAISTLTSAALRPGTTAVAAASAAGRAGSTAAFRPAPKQALGGKALSHNARSFTTAAAATEAPPTPVVATTPSM